MLTIEKIKTVEIPRNVSRANNLLYSPVAVYNDSVNLYQAILTVVDALSTPGVTDLGVVQAATSVGITSSTGADTSILSADSTRAGVMTAEDFDLLHAIDLWSGLGGASDLGTFTGTIISDNTDLKTALQELETEVDSLIISGGADGNGIYDGSGTVDVSGSGLTIDMSADAGYFYIKYSNSSEGLTLYNHTNNVDGWAQLASQDGTSYVYTDGDAGSVLQSSTGEFVIGKTESSFSDSRAPGSQVGIVYAADYSADFVDRSLIDKGFLDAELTVVSDSVAEVANDVANLVTLTGVAVDSTNLGTFSGSTISNNQTIKAALQELELEVESIITGGPGTTNLSSIYTATTFTVTSDTGTNALINAATTSLAGAMTGADKTNLDALVTLSGVSGASVDLGTFTGTTITDNVDVKTALQELETAVDAFSAASGLPAGTDTQTIRYNGTTQVASSILTNDGTNIGINTAPDANFDLLVAGPIHANAGILVSTGTGDPSGSLAASGLRLINTTGGTGETYNIGSIDTGELGIYYGGGLTWRMFNDGHVSLNDASNHGMYTISSDLGAASDDDALVLLYYAGNDSAYIRFRDQSDVEVGAIHAEGGNLEIEVPTIFTITAGTEGYNFNGVGNLVFPNQASDPGSPAEGSIWYNSTDTRFNVQDDTGVESIAFLSDLPIDPAGSFSVQDSVATYTVGDDNSVYLRANSADIVVTLSDAMREGEFYYLYIKGFDPYTVRVELESSVGNEWWIIGDNNETVSDAIYFTFDYTDRNSYMAIQRRGSRFYTRYIAY